MKLLATFATLLPLLSLTLGAPRNTWDRNDCAEWTAAQGGNWEDDGELTENHARKNIQEISKSAFIKVWHDRDIGPNTGYMYTLWGGIGAFDPIYPGKIVLTARADRTEGEGMGQVFRVNFLGDGDVMLKSYWITPQHVCYIAPPPGVSLSTIKKITAMHRID
jgi:hypothetical protein